MRRHLGAMVLAGALAAMPCGAQSKPSDNPAPCSVTPQPDPCGTTPAPASKPSAMQKFPFPGESSGSSPAPADSGTPSLSGAPSAPDAPNVPSAPAAKKDFPFPGDADKPDTAASPGASGSSSSSSSSSGDDSPAVDANGNPVAPALQDKGTEGTPAQPGRHILHRVNPIGTKLQSTDERESEDIDIAHYYVQTGDLKGAYLRGQDAVKTAPDDPEAHFVLAEIALKLNKKDEAIAEYNACLKLDPVEKEAKDARKALARLKP